VWNLIAQRGALAQERATRVDLERRLADKVAQLEASGRELDGIGYSVSHDLRAPLRAIDGFSRILEEDYGDRLDDEGRRLLKVVRSNSQKMGRMMEDVLVYSRAGRAQLSVVAIDMRGLAENALREIGWTEDAPAAVIIGELPRARGDTVLVRQALASLLSNAVKFSSANAQPRIEVTGYEAGAESVYCVKDNGVGFEMRYYDRLFQLFQRLHAEDQFPGDGVGLAIAQRIAARHGGRLWAESAPGAGATFYFALPNEGSTGNG